MNYTLMKSTILAEVRVLPFNDDLVDEMMDPKGGRVLRKMATEIAKDMIANGCITVKKEYDIERQGWKYYYIAHPFKKKAKLP